MPCTKGQMIIVIYRSQTTINIKVAVPAKEKAETGEGAQGGPRGAQEKQEGALAYYDSDYHHVIYPVQTYSYSPVIAL